MDVGSQRSNRHSSTELAEIIAAIAWIDTHEHLVEERHRVRDDGHSFIDAIDGSAVCIPADWTSLIAHYGVDDLVSAGLPATAAAAVLGADLDPLEKWRLAEPYFEATRATGYLRAVDLSTERLFGLRLSRRTCEAIDDRARALRQEGYYAHILRDVANIERCQVNSLEASPFCVTQSPELLDQDFSLLPLVFGLDHRSERMSGIQVGGLDDYVDVIEWCFERFAHMAVAVKCQWAYFRPLAIAPVDAPPRRAFAHLRRGEATLSERRQVEDFLFDRCVRLATDRGLPVKLHLGSFAGNSQPRLGDLASHVRDVTPLVQAYPWTQFVLMHMAWPHQHELLALAKHCPNVVVDLCWAWVVAPLATREFVRLFLTSVPATKLLCFGGDYLTVETVVGHAELARRGLQAALESLIVDGWLTTDEALALVPQLMRGNAERLFPKNRVSASR
jgi:hypothetical protein